METLEYPILPVIRRAVARMAVITRYALFLCAGLALLEPVLLLLRLPLAGILSGMASTFLLYTGLSLLVILLSWSHTVLLAGQGTVVTRWLMWVGAILSPLAPVCWCYTLMTGKLLLYRQVELPYILAVLVLLTAVVNIPRMAAAPWKLQVQLVALPLLLLLIFAFDAPGFILVSAAFKLLAAALASNPLRQLAAAAPRIISLPPHD